MPSKLGCGELAPKADAQYSMPTQIRVPSTATVMPGIADDRVTGGVS